MQNPFISTGILAVGCSLENRRLLNSMRKMPKNAEEHLHRGTKRLYTPREQILQNLLCAYTKGIRLCFECSIFPCETAKERSISYGYCQYLAGKQ
jgi:hypothetical protein